MPAQFDLRIEIARRLFVRIVLGLLFAGSRWRRHIGCGRVGLRRRRRSILNTCFGDGRGYFLDGIVAKLTLRSEQAAVVNFDFSVSFMLCHKVIPQLRFSIRLASSKASASLRPRAIFSPLLHAVNSRVPQHGLRWVGAKSRCW